jgi:transposase
VGGRPPTFDKQLYKRRNVVERCFNRLKQWRGIATQVRQDRRVLPCSRHPRFASEWA